MRRVKPETGREAPGGPADVREGPGRRASGPQGSPGSARLGSWAHDPGSGVVSAAPETVRTTLGPLQLDSGGNGEDGV